MVCHTVEHFHSGNSQRMFRIKPLMDHKITLMNRARCGIVSGIPTLRFIIVEGITIESNSNLVN